MPKLIELTVEIDVQRVSCPGVWLCQDGRVSLTVFALGTSYQTCLLPPMFPLLFKDIFYFRKRFQESCALNNICCLLKDETIYCELVQWSDNCNSGECTILAQYLGALNDILFPPNMCSNDGVDLLMRRSKDFPGILSPKIEIATKVRIDEVWNQPCNVSSAKVSACHCASLDADPSRQKPVCHSAQYHRIKCNNVNNKRPVSMHRSRSRSGSRSCCSLAADAPRPAQPRPNVICACPNPITKSRISLSQSPRSQRRVRKGREYNVYNVETSPDSWRPSTLYGIDNRYDDDVRSSREATNSKPSPQEDVLNKIILESRYIDQNRHESDVRMKRKKISKTKVTPCVCEICKRYHELFHTDC